MALETRRRRPGLEGDSEAPLATAPLPCARCTVVGVEWPLDVSSSSGGGTSPASEAALCLPTRWALRASGSHCGGQAGGR